MPTLKDRKRILNKDGTPAKVVQKLDQSPVFRQNGYHLKLDAVNGDDLNTINNPTYNISQLQDLDIEFDFYNDSSLTGGLFSFSSSGESSYFKLEKTLSFGDRLVVRYAGTNNDTIFPIGSANLGNGWINFKFKNLKYYINDIEVQSTSNRTFNNNLLFFIFGRAVFTTQNLSTKLKGLKIQNETFNFSESYDTTITGDNGTVATINTSSAQAENYTNTEIWQKNSFALAFDSVNQEYVDFNKTYNIPNSSDINFEIEFYNYNNVYGGIAKIYSSDNVSSISFYRSATFSNKLGGYYRLRKDICSLIKQLIKNGEPTFSLPQRDSFSVL